MIKLKCPVCNRHTHHLQNNSSHTQTHTHAWMHACMHACTHHHHHHSCPSQSNNNISGTSDVTADQTPMRRCVHTLGRLWQQLGWPSALFWLGVWCQAVTVAFPRRLGLHCGLPASKHYDLLQSAPSPWQGCHRRAESSTGSLCSALSGDPAC